MSVSASDRLLGCYIDGVAHVRVDGRGLAPACPALWRFIQQALAEGTRAIEIELDACDYGDSTFLGTLLQIRKSTQSQPSVTLTLIAPTTEFETALRRMGVRRLFDVRPAVVSSNNRTWQPLEHEPTGTCSHEYRAVVTSAHRELAECSETCGEQYRAIAEGLEREQHRSRLNRD